MGSPNQSGRAATIASQVVASWAPNSLITLGTIAARRSYVIGRLRAMSEQTERLVDLRERLLAAKEFL
jgi:hypothetical protein